MLHPDAPLLVRVTEIARRQHGIVDAAELEEAGVSRSTVRVWARNGKLFRLHHAAYSVIPPSMLTQEGRWLAAVRAGGTSAFLSHGPAGQLQWLIDRRERLALHVSVADRSRRSLQGIVIHRPRSLPRADTTTYLRVPTTTPTRTIWDLASVLPSLLLRRAFEKAERRGKLQRTRLAELLESSPTHKGAGTIRALLGYEVDFLWESARLVVEADGGDHLSRAQRDRGNLRDADLQRAGYLVRRYSSEALASRPAVAAEVLAILRERGMLR